MPRVTSECDGCGERYYRLQEHPALCPMCGRESAPHVPPEVRPREPDKVTAEGVVFDGLMALLVLAAMLAVGWLLSSMGGWM